MKTKLFLLLALFASVNLSAINFDVLGSALSSSSQAGNRIEDTVSNADGIDNLSFVNELHTGANEIIVKIKNPDLGNLDAMAGLMIRENNLPGSPFLSVYINGNRKLTVRERWYQGTGSYVHVRGVPTILRKAAPVWLKIVKSGQLCGIYVKYGKNQAWQYIDNGIYMPAGDYYAGIMSANDGESSPAIFDYRQFSIAPLALRMSAPIPPKAYPNPARERISLNFTPGKVALYSIDGRPINLIEISSVSYDLSNLPAGAYYLKADDYILKFFKIQ